MNTSTESFVFPQTNTNNSAHTQKASSPALSYEAPAQSEAPAPANNPEAGPVTRFLSKANLVLEGGAMRAQFTAGVLDFFLEQGLQFNTVMGTSAGALCGYNYVAGQIGRTCLVNTQFCSDPRYLSMKSFMRTGNAYGREFVFHDIADELIPFDYAAFDASPSTMVAVCSDLELGEADYHVCKDAHEGMPYVIASSSMPLISQIVEVDGKKLLDGGTCDSVPIEYSLRTQAEKHVVVLTQPPSYQKKPNKLMPLMRQQYSHYPYYLERCEYRHFEYNRCYRRLARMHAAGEAFVIQPQQPIEVGSMEHDSGKLMHLYEQGYEQALLNWPALKTYLEL
jgi:predicted patatin/cPLA2 family phospholipase